VTGVLATLCYVVPICLYYARPIAYVRLITEDSYGEWATFFAWAFAFALTSAALFTHRSLRKPGVVLFSLACLFVAGEEISWGQRIFHIAVPARFAALNTQGELNLHNLFHSRDYRIAYILVACWAVALPVFSWGASLIGRDRPARFMRPLGLPRVPLHAVPMFVVALIYLFAFSAPIDDASLSVGECGELYLGLAAMLLALQLICERDLPLGKLRAPSVTVIVAAVLTVAACAASAAVLLGNEFALRARLNQFAATLYREHGEPQQALELFDYIEAHPQYQDHGVGQWSHGSTSLHHAELLLRLGHRAAARPVLAAALAEQEAELQALEAQRSHIKAGKPVGVLRDEAAIQRNRGRILRLMKEDEASREAFTRSLRIDRSRMTGDQEQRAWALWSLARTRFAMDDERAARREVRRALRLTQDKGLEKVLGGWVAHALDSPS
jgi:tetratricopeptide (TPR) repeat protein